MRTDGIYHVVRAFSDADVIHEEGEVNPVRDMEIIVNELIAKDLQIIEKTMAELQAVIARKNLKSAKEEMEVAEKAKKMLEEGKNVRDGEWNGKEIDSFVEVKWS